MSKVVLTVVYHRQEAAPPPPQPPVVINRYSDDQLRSIILRMRERHQLFKDKVLDHYASSPEITPPVSEYLDGLHIRAEGKVQGFTDHHVQWRVA